MLTLALTTLLLSPWNGADLPTSSAAAVKYQLTIKDAPGTTVHLRATHVARGWIAAFCDHRTCSPDQADQTMPASGRVTLQFELIREEDSAPRASGAHIETDNGKTVVVPSSSPR